MMTDQEIIDVVTAHMEGRQIQFKAAGNIWENAPTPAWHFRDKEYRIKPEPFECWVNVYPEGDPTLHISEEKARRLATTGVVRAAVRMREIVE